MVGVAPKVGFISVPACNASRIPAVWAFNYFQTKIDNLTAEMTYTSKEMIDYLIKGVSGEFGRSRFTREFNTASGQSITQ